MEHKEWIKLDLQTGHGNFDPPKNFKCFFCEEDLCWNGVAIELYFAGGPSGTPEPVCIYCYLGGPEKVKQTLRNRIEALESQGQRLCQIAALDFEFPLTDEYRRLVRHSDDDFVF